MSLNILSLFARSPFPGGLHLPDLRATREKAIAIVPGPRIAYVPLAQHTGAAARPLVKKGEKVKTGTMIGERTGFISANVHAPISGQVIALKEHPHPKLGTALACIIENDGKDTLEEPPRQYYQWAAVGADDLLAQVISAGITGQGGGSFPTHVKLAPSADKPVDTLIINGCECEPMLTADFRLMIEMASDIVEGALIMRKILNAPTLIFAVEADRSQAAKAIEELASDVQAQVKLVESTYPMGSETQLIYAVLGRRVPKACIPSDVGCIVHNVATAAAVAQAVKFGRPFVDRVITVAGDNINEPKNVRVRFGTPAIEVIDFCGGYRGEPGQIIFGGPMMGTAQYSEQVPVIKGTTAIVANQIGKTSEEGPCVRCARCVDVCPARLIPCELASLAEHRKFDAARGYAIFDCIECGCCAYVCPTRRKLVHHIRFGKAELARQESAPR